MTLVSRCMCVVNCLSDGVDINKSHRTAFHIQNFTISYSRGEMLRLESLSVMVSCCIANAQSRV